MIIKSIELHNFRILQSEKRKVQKRKTKRPKNSTLFFLSAEFFLRCDGALDLCWRRVIEC